MQDTKEKERRKTKQIKGDNMKTKKIGIIAILLIAMIAIVTTPASAYTVAPSSGQSSPCNGWGSNNYLATHVVQLCYSGSEATSLSLFPGPAADVVINVARAKGMEIKRSKGSIEGEIRAHALGWLAGW